MDVKTRAHVTIDLGDVARAGSVEAALHAWCRESDSTSSGVVGPSFSTSGPGPGWSVQHDETDFAQRAMREGAQYYLDAADGRLISAEYVEDEDEDEDEDETLTDLGGCKFRVGDWSDDSVVRIECPSIEDAIEAPERVAEMAQAVIDHHAAKSDCGAWQKLIESIRGAAEALEQIDLAELASD
jgi:hypothetical protein